MLFFFAWGLASYGSSGFPFFFIHTLSIWSESWSYSRLPSYGFYPGSGNLSGAETAWPLLEKDAPIPLALPYDLGQLSSYLFYPLTKATHTSSFWGRAPPLWVLWGSSSFSYWKSSVSLFFSFIFFVLRREALSLTNTSSSENNPSSITQPSFCWFSSKICCKRTDLSFWPTQSRKYKSPSRSGWPRSLSKGYPFLPSVN